MLQGTEKHLKAEPAGMYRGPGHGWINGPRKEMSHFANWMLQPSPLAASMQEKQSVQASAYILSTHMSVRTMYRHDVFQQSPYQEGIPPSVRSRPEVVDTPFKGGLYFPFKRAPPLYRSSHLTRRISRSSYSSCGACPSRASRRPAAL